MHVGGSARKTTLTAPRARDLRRDRAGAAGAGLIFVGIDVIGDYLTEINVTSPTGLQEINRLTASSSKSACGTRSSAATTNSTPASPPERAFDRSASLNPR